MLGPVDNPADNQRGETLAVADNRVEGLYRQVFNERHAFENISQLIEQRLYERQKFVSLMRIDSAMYHGNVPIYDFTKTVFISITAFHCDFGRANEFIGYSPSAETTTITGSRQLSTICLTLDMLSTEPTDVPPNFNTFISSEFLSVLPSPTYGESYTKLQNLVKKPYPITVNRDNEITSSPLRGSTHSRNPEEKNMFYIVTLSSILLSLNPLKHATTEEYNQTLSTATQCHLFSLLLQK